MLATITSLIYVLVGFFVNRCPKCGAEMGDGPCGRMEYLILIRGLNKNVSSISATYLKMKQNGSSNVSTIIPLLHSRTVFINHNRFTWRLGLTTKSAAWPASYQNARGHTKGCEECSGASCLLAETDGHIVYIYLHLTRKQIIGCIV